MQIASYNKSVNLSFLFIIAAIFILQALVPMNMFAPIVVILAGLMIGIFIINFSQPQQDDKFLIKLFIYSYISRIAVAFMLHMITLDWKYIGGVSRGFNGFFIGDGWGYNMNGWTIATRLSHGLSIEESVIRTMSASSTLHAYDYINGFVYLLVGKSPLTMFFLNCFLGAITSVFIYLIVILIFEKKVAKLAAALTAFWPSLFLWSTQNLKEPLTIFFVVMFFWGFISFLKKFNPIYLLIVFLSTYLLAKFRMPIAQILVVSVFLHLVFLSSKIIKHGRIIIIAIILLIGLFYMGLGSAKISFFDPFGGNKFLAADFFGKIDLIRGGHAYSNLAVLPDYRIKNLPTLIAYMPIGLFVLFFSPFPWQLFSTSQILAVPEMLIWYGALFYLVKGILLAMKEKLNYVFSILVFILLTALLLAIAEGNIGTLFRHRGIIFEFLFIFTALGLVTSRKKTDFAKNKSK